LVLPEMQIKKTFIKLKMELVNKIKFDIPYNTQGGNNPEYETEEDMFSYSDVKEAVTKFKEVIKTGIENNEINDIKYCIVLFDEIFGDFEKLEKDIKEGLL
jgi:hypothetical protein